MGTAMLLTRAEAVALVKRTARERARICLHVFQDAPIADKPEHVFPSALTGYVGLSRTQALRLVDGMLSPVIEARGGRIRITRADGCGLRPTYWIG